MNLWKSALPTLLLASHGLLAAQATPVGLWETFDDRTGQAQSHVKIIESEGTLSAVVDLILDPAKADALCTACEDERKDQPIQGMTFMRGVPPLADTPLTWQGGEILDPKTGRSYRVRIKLIEDGKRLEVKGYVGSPMFGRTQTWSRVDIP